MNKDQFRSSQINSAIQLVTAIAIVAALCGCQSTYYSVWEKLGKHKRDLLRDYVQDASKEQQKAKVEFKDALTRLKEITGFDGGKLEEAYRASKQYPRLGVLAPALLDAYTKAEELLR